MTTSRADLGRVALGAPALKEVFIVAVPDCLLIKSWARTGRSDAEEAATHLGEAFKAGARALAMASPAETTAAVTVEADAALVRLERVSDDLVAGFIFDRSAPLGLVRVQSRQLRDHIQSSLEQFSRPDSPAFPDATPALTAPPVPSGPREPPPKPSITSEVPAVPSLPKEVPTSASPPAAEDDEPFAHDRTPVEADVAPYLGVAEDLHGARPDRFPPDVPTKPMARPRAVRLLDFFRRYAPDPHASLLRLSLKTGIPVERLEKPESLDDDQVEKIATAVRDILGQDNVGL